MTTSNDRDEVLAAVKKDGWALGDADESLKKDKEIVMTAVKNDERAIEYADTRVRQSS